MTGSGLLAAHPLGVSRSLDGGRAWEPSGAGIPLRLGRLAVAASGPYAFAEADGRLFRLDGGTWTEWGRDAVGLLGADPQALYGVSADDGLVWCSPDGGPWTAYGDGLPAPPLTLASGTAWRWAALVSGGLWRRRATSPPSPVSTPRLDGVPLFLRDPAEIVLTLAAPAHATLSLVGPDGDLAVQLADGTLAAGVHRLTLTPAALPPGLYHCRLVAGDHTVSRPLAVLP